jgi:hypothetical protein
MDVETGLGGLVPKRIERSMAHGGENPRAHTAARRVEPAPAPERQKRVLDDVFGERPATAHPIRERERRPTVTLEQHLVRDTVAPADVISQLLIRQPA